MDQKFYDVASSLIEKGKEIDRGVLNGYGYIVGEDESGTILMMFIEKDCVLIPIFVGESAPVLAGRTLELFRKDRLMIFRYKYGKKESFENVKSDIVTFAHAIHKKEREFIDFCATHD